MGLPKINIGLARRGRGGSLAELLLGVEGREGSTALIDGYATPRDACRSAAKKLRILAEKFELLGQQKDQYRASVQDRINKMTASGRASALGACPGSAFEPGESAVNED